ncbi:hypothetical protein HJ015_24030, partial [Vibrio parahaemolyticus]|nr:hypothetical protein [Vibrio parahaemolyticus]
SDHSVTGAILRDEIDDFIQQHDRYRNKITQLVPDNVEALKKKIAQLNKENVVLFWTYYRDKDGVVGSERDWIQINKASNAPL